MTRAEVEDFLYHEADLLDRWKLDDWLGLLTDDASYYVPPNDKPDADHRYTLFTVADDIVRLLNRQRFEAWRAPRGRYGRRRRVRRHRQGGRRTGCRSRVCANSRRIA